MAKKKKPVEKERIPEGMRREDYADAAFRKKVTLIMGSVLLVFVIGVCAVIFAGWYKNEQLNKEFEQQVALFNSEKETIKKTLATFENHEDKTEVKIELTDKNFVDWINELDSSYQCGEDDENYAAYAGATIHLQGMFVTRDFKGGTQYWVYRKHSHEHDAAHHEHEASSDNVSSEIGEMIPIEVIFRDDADVQIPKDGTWVDVTGIVGPDSTKNLSAVRYAEITVMDEAGQEYVE